MGPGAERLLRLAVAVVYGRRPLTFAFLMAFTAIMLVQALRIQPDAGFEKQIPLQHPFMQVFRKYEKAFGGANLVTVALIRTDGKTIYEAGFLDALKRATDVFFLPGVDRSRVTSIFTPGVRYLEVVEGGFSGDDVVPRNYAPSPEMFQLIRDNVGKAGVIGPYVTNDQRARSRRCATRRSSSRRARSRRSARSGSRPASRCHGAGSRVPSSSGGSRRAAPETPSFAARPRRSARPCGAAPYRGHR